MYYGQRNSTAWGTFTRIISPNWILNAYYIPGGGHVFGEYGVELFYHDGLDPSRYSHASAEGTQLLAARSRDYLKTACLDIGNHIDPAGNGVLGKLLYTNVEVIKLIGKEISSPDYRPKLLTLSHRFDKISDYLLGRIAKNSVGLTLI